MGQPRTGSVSSFQHWSTVWLLKRMGFYRILSPRYLIKSEQAIVMLFLSLQKGGGWLCADVLSYARTLAGHTGNW